MPIKVRCRGCQTVLNAPDKARGKALRCPHCQTVVKIPTGRAAGAAGAGGAPARTPRRRAPAAGRSAPAADEDFIANLDLSRVEDRHARICPRCGAEVPEDDDECPKCGTDVETGRLTEAARKRRARRGAPDPALFYKEAWRNPWNFLTNNVGLAVKTGLFVAIFAILSTNATIMAQWSTGGPPIAFWRGIAFLANLGGPGWILFLTIKIIDTTLAKKNEVKDAKFDFFSAIALGVRLSIWPFVLVLPFFWFPPAWLLPLLVFPIAMIHMSKPYTYKAWLPWEMAKIWAKNIGPSLYWLMVGIIVTLPAALLIGGVALLTLWLTGPLEPTIMDIATWLKETIQSNEPIDRESWFFDRMYILVGINVFLIPFVLFAYMVLAFPNVFMMRVTGLLAYYNRPTLELVEKTTSNEPAGFGPRYLAYLIDWFIVTAMNLGVVGIYFFLVAAAIFFGLFGPDGGPLAWPLTILGWAVWGLTVFIPLRYYIKSESDEGGQATLGKWALGLIVVDMNNNPVSKGVTTKRFFARILSGLILGIGYLMAIWHPRKQTLHDQMTDTQVVWRGDE